MDMAQILIVDDDPAIRHLLREILEEEGHAVEDAPDGRVGLQRFRKKRPDLVMTDILMPEKDGVELIMELQEVGFKVRIVAMSGGGRGLDAAFNLRMAQDFGANRLLVKPFTRKQALEAVQEALAV
ncbi:MAG: response regulator [Magnetococcales bacterium]|nr:response regulator [Magnetococcales bacterium]MBF0439761.1 response regulator [Magnetococcales bacterium]